MGGPIGGTTKYVLLGSTKYKKGNETGNKNFKYT